MKKYKVVSPKGFAFGGSVLKQGETFDAESKSAHIQTGLHFAQIAEAKAEPEEKAKPKAEDKAKAEPDK